MKHLLDAADLSKAQFERLFSLTDSFVEVSGRAIPKVPALRGKTVAWLFYESSTRTRLSFETAAKRLSADTMNFSVASSSVSKGESLRDTAETIEAMGIDAIVVRHASSGVPRQLTQWVDASIISAGDGWHGHPTQSLLDAYTLRSTLAKPRFGGDPDAGPASLEGKHIAIVGDVAHSRVARSNIAAFGTLGAKVTLVAPPTLLPPGVTDAKRHVGPHEAKNPYDVEVSYDLDEVLEQTDVVYLLRMQTERMSEQLVPSLREYTSRYGLTAERAKRLAPTVPIMHPGPMNRGVEIAPEVADLDQAVIIDQVRNGVATRMAVLFLLLGAGLDDETEPLDTSVVDLVQEAATAGQERG